VPGRHDPATSAPDTGPADGLRASPIRISCPCGTAASIGTVWQDGADGVVIALDLRRGEDPRLPALADTWLCAGR